MLAGKLRNRVTIQRRHETRDAVGAVVVTYLDVRSVWASVEPLTGREFFAAQQVQADAVTRIRLRYMPDAVPGMRVEFVTVHASPQSVDLFDVEAVMHTNERRRETLLMCKKRYIDGFRGGA